MSLAPVAPPLCNYWTVNDSSPGSQVWDLAAGAFVALADATFNSWLSQLAANPTGAPYFPFNLQILSAASSDAGVPRSGVDPGGPCQGKILHGGLVDLSQLTVALARVITGVSGPGIGEGLSEQSGIESLSGGQDG